VIILLASAAQAHAHYTENSIDQHLSKLIDSLFDRTLQMRSDASPPYHSDLQNATLGKPAQLAMPNSNLAVASALPTSHLTGKFGVETRFRPVPNVKSHALCQLRNFQKNVAKTKGNAVAAGTGFCRANPRDITASAQTAPAETIEKDEKVVRDDLRNIAIVAHVDHGKTTLVDAMLISANVQEDLGKDERTMDSNDQERERGITILAKNVAVEYEGTKINIVDTPGHADFGGEVERVLGMVDGVLLLVDASEGPKPQTRFVLKKAIQMGHKILVVVNKIDRPTARPDYVIDKTFDLFCELGASDEQVDFPIVYTSAINRVAGESPDSIGKDMNALFKKILSLPKPPCDPNGPLQLQISAVSSDTFIGRLGIGRIRSGKLQKNSGVGLSAGPGTDPQQAKIAELFNFDALGRKAVEQAEAGEIVVFSGIQDFNIGDTIVDFDNPVPLEPIEVEQPTMTMTFGINKSPFGGQVGKLLTGRQIRERLEKELETNVALRVQDTADADKFLVSGRGLLHLTVLIETMRREGFELMVGCPQVIEKEIDGVRHEPFESVDIEIPEEFSGNAISLLNNRKGCMVQMGAPNAEGLMPLQYEVPARGMNGVKSALLSASKGLALMTSSFAGYKPYAGDFEKRSNGNILSIDTGKATTYSIENAQKRGTLFVGPGEEIYVNQIVGEASRGDTMKMNLCKAKTLDNMRAAGKDKDTGVVTKKDFTLEEAIEFIDGENEYVEITPDAIRMGQYDVKKR